MSLMIEGWKKPVGYGVEYPFGPIIVQKQIEVDGKIYVQDVESDEIPFVPVEMFSPSNCVKMGVDILVNPISSSPLALTANLDNLQVDGKNVSDIINQLKFENNE